MTLEPRLARRSASSAAIVDQAHDEGRASRDNVVTYTIKDPKKVGIYDFNELIYDPERKRLSITTGVPIEIEVTVSRFELDIEEPGTEAPSGGVAQ